MSAEFKARASQMTSLLTSLPHCGLVKIKFTLIPMEEPAGAGDQCYLEKQGWRESSEVATFPSLGPQQCPWHQLESQPRISSEAGAWRVHWDSKSKAGIVFLLSALNSILGRFSAVSWQKIIDAGKYFCSQTKCLNACLSPNWWWM